MACICIIIALGLLLACLLGIYRIAASVNDIRTKWKVLQPKKRYYIY